MSVEGIRVDPRNIEAIVNSKCDRGEKFLGFSWVLPMVRKGILRHRIYTY